MARSKALRIETETESAAARRNGSRRAGAAVATVIVAGLGFALGVAGAAAPASATELVELAPASGAVVAGTPSIETGPDGVVHFRMPLTQAVERQVFALVGPDRLVVDLPELDWRFTGRAPNFRAVEGVKGMRVGLFRPGRSRLVIDLDGAAREIGHTVRPSGGGAGFAAELVLDFRVDQGVEADAADARKMLREPAMLVAEARLRRSSGAPVEARRPLRRPKGVVIAIDAGHGGKDAGAVYGGVKEKDLVLRVARELKRSLEALDGPRRVDVVMTRDSDVFISLDQRVVRAREAGADLFISLHANAYEPDRRIAGAGVYTLSDVASDRLTSRLARRENAADAIPGVPMAGVDDQVRKILVDFRRRQMMDRSHFLAKRLVAEMRGQLRLERKRPHRYANFRVLRTFDMPSVLVELGYLTNIEDRRAMENPAWRRTASEAIAGAVKKWLDDGAGVIREAALR